MCKYCGGNGEYLTRLNGLNYVVECRHCSAHHDVKVRKLLEAAMLPNKPNVAPLAQSVEYVEHFPELERERNNWILFSGIPGAGKTTQSVWAASQIIKRYEKPTRFYNAFDWARRMVAAKRRNEERDKLFSGFEDADLVILDDFLKSIPKPGSYEYEDYREAILEAFWTRYDTRKPMIITTQLNFSEVAAFDEALAGRLVEMCGTRIVRYTQNAKNWRIDKMEEKQNYVGV